MNPTLLYQWQERLGKHLPSLNKWQMQNVALFSLGIIQARSSQQRHIVEHLAAMGQADSLKRRLQRFLANEQVEMATFFAEWTGWVTHACPQSHYTLLVDETKLGDRLGVMVVALAYEGRCIPLAWHCYPANDATRYPVQGQVGLIDQLLQQVKVGLPAQAGVTVQADRGIGTSPDLAKIVAAHGWYYLFRVTAQTKIVTKEGRDYTISQMVQPGQMWSAEGKVFKRRGKLSGRACAVWDEAYGQALALVTNHPDYSGREYAQRNWQEQTFRDLKGQGWQWDQSHVWQPAHAQRLLILLVVAYDWMLALGVQATLKGMMRLKRLKTGALVRQLSLFQAGVRLFRALLLDAQAIYPGLWFPDHLPIP
jgi:hypothetical protein